MTTELTTQKTFSPLQILDAGSMDSIGRFADFMSNGRSTVPDHLKNNPSDCMAITMQAMSWGMNPFAVAQQTSLINGSLAYGAQLVNAVISSSKTIKGRFHYEYSDGWERLAGKVGMGKNGNNKTVPVATWSKSEENGLWCKVGAVLAGEDEITWGEPVYLASIITRNSPLWITNPKQQISYLALKYWSRLYTPDVILGVYTPEELSEPEYEIEEKVVNPTPSTSDLNAALADKPKKVKKAPKPKKQPKPEVVQPDQPKEQQDQQTVQQNEPVTIDNEPDTPTLGDTGAIDEQSPPDFGQQLLDSLKMVSTKEDYIDNAKLYRELYEAGHLTPEQDEEIKKQLSILHQNLSQQQL